MLTRHQRASILNRILCELGCVSSALQRINETLGTLAEDDEVLGSEHQEEVQARILRCVEDINAVHDELAILDISLRELIAHHVAGTKILKATSENN